MTHNIKLNKALEVLHKEIQSKHASISPLDAKDPTLVTGPLDLSPKDPVGQAADVAKLQGGDSNDATNISTAVSSITDGNALDTEAPVDPSVIKEPEQPKLARAAAVLNKNLKTISNKSNTPLNVDLDKLATDMYKNANIRRQVQANLEAQHGIAVAKECVAAAMEQGKALVDQEKYAAALQNMSVAELEGLAKFKQAESAYLNSPNISQREKIAMVEGARLAATLHDYRGNIVKLAAMQATEDTGLPYNEEAISGEEPTPEELIAIAQQALDAGQITQEEYATAVNAIASQMEPTEAVTEGDETSGEMDQTAAEAEATLQAAAEAVATGEIGEEQFQEVAEATVATLLEVRLDELEQAVDAGAIAPEEHAAILEGLATELSGMGEAAMAEIQQPVQEEQKVANFNRHLDFLNRSAAFATRV